MSLGTLPGEPALVQSQASAMVAAAERMTRAAAALRRLDVDASSDAVRELVENTDEVAEVMQRAATRYRGAGEALLDYARVLDRAQADAALASRQHEATDVGGAALRLAGEEVAARDPLLLLPDREADRAHVIAEVTRARQHLAEQQAAATDASQRWEHARSDVDDAADRAIDRINASIEKSGLRDGFWKQVGAWFDTATAALQDVLNAIAPVLSVAALLLGWVPFLGQVLAVAALAVTLISVAILVYQAARSGRSVLRTFSEVAFALVNVIPGVKAGRAALAMARKGDLVARVGGGVIKISQRFSMKRVLKVEVPKPGAATKSARFEAFLHTKAEGFLADQAKDQLKGSAEDLVKDFASRRDAELEAVEGRVPTVRVQCVGTGSGGRGW